MELRLQYQSLGVHQEVSFSPFHLLGGVEAALLASHPRGLGRLGVHYRGAGLWVPAQPRPQALAQHGVQALPRTVDAPSPEPVVDAPPRRELARQQAPGAAAFQHVEDGLEDLARGVDLGASPPVGGGQVRLDVSELFVGKVGRVAHNGPKRRPSHPSFRIYQTVSLSTSMNKLSPRYKYISRKSSSFVGGTLPN